MKIRFAVVAGLLLAASFAGFAQRGRWGGSRGASSTDNLPQANSDVEKRILGVLDEARKAGETFENVPVSDGRMLRLLTETAGARHVVEIGTSTGLSGLWFCLALEKTGGKLTTFEYDAGRAAIARQHFRKAGVDRIATIVEGDAHQTISRLKEPADVVFIDADKGGYVDYLNKLLPLVRPGGLIVAHNIDMVPDYDRAVQSNPALDTVYYVGGGGMAITLKKR
jgi:predicted O-methyltransferase YrrM